jgi:predicted NUDIX family NTP pyrophosphohydrolase
MIIKLDTSVFRLDRPKTETSKKVFEPLTRAQWITADRIVIASLFAATIAGAILF